jgi:hypothetical protein
VTERKQSARYGQLLKPKGESVQARLVVALSPAIIEVFEEGIEGLNDLRRIGSDPDA